MYYVHQNLQRESLDVVDGVLILVDMAKPLIKAVSGEFHQI